MKNNALIISGVHLDLTEALKTMVREKTEKLFNHEERIIRLRVELELHHTKSTGKKEAYIAKGHIEINGPTLVVSATSTDLYKSIDQMVERLDRKLRRRSRLHRVKRKNIHQVEIEADLPKTRRVA